MTIREAAPEDAAAISEVAMRATAHWGYGQAFLEDCRPELTWTSEEIERDDVLVWDEGGSVAGVTTHTGEAPDGTLRAVFVDPDLHGRGLGRALAEALLARAAAAGFRSLTIAADPNAEGFSRAVGATRIGEVPSGTRAGRVLPLLRFDLGGGAR